MMPLSVEQAAEAAKVTPKTIRTWIRDEGLPVLQAGGKGAGNASVIDGARFPRWLMEHQGRRRGSMADYFLEVHPGQNPLRELVDLFRYRSLYAIAVALRDWADDPDAQGALDYRKTAISPEQARTVAWQVYGAIVLILGAYQVDRFDQDVQDEFGGDLDDLMSLLTEGDFRTTWPEPECYFPPPIQKFAPKEFRQRLAALQTTDEVKRR